VTRLSIVPSHLRAVLDVLEERDGQQDLAQHEDQDTAHPLANLRCCVTTGEPLPQALRARVLRQLPWVTLWNNFGCTELNDTTYCAPGAQESGALFVPIGLPIANVRLYVLDGALNPLPLGVAGELCVGGLGMAHGYWRLPGLSAARFVPDPFSGVPGGRLYRTGDVVRRLANGTLEYLGREDFEVKIRGHRIDVRQVELALASFSGVALAAVAAWQREDASTQLVAYCVLEEQQAMLDVGALRSYLAQLLPDYMVPGLYLTLDALPCLPNGKFDRKALPAPDSQKLLQLPYVAPSTATEQIIVDIWAELLGLPPQQIGIHDNFFALGGHSLMATQVLSKLLEKFKTQFPVQVIFDRPTIAGLAQLLDIYIETNTSGNMDALLPLLEGLSDSDAEKLLTLFDTSIHGAVVNDA